MKTTHREIHQIFSKRDSRLYLYKDGHGERLMLGKNILLQIKKDKLFVIYGSLTEQRNYKDAVKPILDFCRSKGLIIDELYDIEDDRGRGYTNRYIRQQEIITYMENFSE